MLFDENNGINTPEEPETPAAPEPPIYNPPEAGMPEDPEPVTTAAPEPDTPEPVFNAAPETPAPEPAAPAAPEPAPQWQAPQWQPPQSQWQAPDSAQPDPEPVRQPYTQEHESWRDPAVESAAPSGDAYTPGRYAYGAQNYQQPAMDVGSSGKRKKHKQKEKKSHGFLKAVCLAVICALVSGLASWAVVDYMLEHREQSDPGKQVVLGSIVSNSGEDGGQTAPQPAVTGVLTGNQIYNLGLQQVVGVNTSLTTNIFGQTSTSAVSGSGFIISEDGYILTNYHVISYAVVYGGELTVLMEDGAKYPAEVVGYIESNDVAVIKIDAAGLTPVAFGDSDAMQVGETVYAIGNPLGELEYTMTDGIVSALDRVISTTDDITGVQTSINMFQISAAVNHGNSGGPVYNSRGEVIGIVTAKYSDADEGIESLGFAIPINDAVSIATQLIEHGYVAGAGLGITGRNVSLIYSEMAMEAYGIPYGVIVESVNSGSAAEAAGIKPGDIITALGDTEVASMDELKMLLRRYTAGETETITVYRMDTRNTGESMDLTITFEEQPVEDQTNTQPSTDQNQGTTTWPWGSWGNWGW